MYYVVAIAGSSLLIHRCEAPDAHGKFFDNETMVLRRSPDESSRIGTLETLMDQPFGHILHSAKALLPRVKALGTGYLELLAHHCTPWLHLHGLACCP